MFMAGAVTASITDYSCSFSKTLKKSQRRAGGNAGDLLNLLTSQLGYRAGCISDESRLAAPATMRHRR
jgi:hypothetical protein